MNVSSLRRFAPAALSFLFILASGSAHAVFRAYISSTGSDANTCTLVAPCRLLPAALAVVADAGEIWMLDSANYNTATVTIGKSVTILAIPGAVGSVVAIAGPAISITAAGLTVALRNLVIVPFPAAGGTEGVLMTGASALTIEHCLIANAPNNGVVILGTGKVSITDSIIRNNGLWSVSLQDGARADISATKMLNNGQGGVYAASLTATTTVATIGESVIAGGAEGLVAYGAVSGGIARIMATRTTIQNTLYPLDSTATASGSASLIAISGMMVTNNVYGWYMNGGGAVIRSLGNNHLVDNGMNFGTLTPAPQQ